MKKILNNYTNIGKILLGISIVSFIFGIIFSFIYSYKMFILGALIASNIHYINFQYFSTKEYWDKNLGPYMHKKSRNIFAVFFTATIISISLGLLNVLKPIISLYACSIGLMGASIACVLNEYGINGPKKKLGIIACITVFFAIISFIYMCKTFLGW